jgi:8-oxo-dGTP pyrophosphatase MutT (NUDIX family)
VLLIYRHRFIPDEWGWELPAGRCDPGETPVQTAVREVREETGWQVRRARALCSMRTSPGLSDQRSHVVVAEVDRYTGPAEEPDEAEQIRWWPRDDLTGLLRSRGVVDAFSLAGLLWYLHLSS